VRHYQAARVYALTSALHEPDAAKALEYLALALRGGYGFDLLATDPDLRPLHGSPDFTRITVGVRAIELNLPKNGNGP
jgi:hypothetical protein